MNMDEARRCWQTQPEESVNQMTDSQLLELVERRSREFDSRIRSRDRRELIAAAVVILFFLPVLVSAGWLARAGVIVIIAGAAWILRKLERARTVQALEESDRPLSTVLVNERARVDAQIRLLESVVSWYIAPIGIGALMVVAGTAGLSWFTLVYAVFVALVGAWIYRLNQRAVLLDLRPRREELARMLEQLKE